MDRFCLVSAFQPQNVKQSYSEFKTLQIIETHSKAKNICLSFETE